jgi:hypothetical protein
MNGIYISIALLVLYGDLIKRYLPAQESALALYTLAIAILFAIFIMEKKNRGHASSSKGAKAVSLVAIVLSVTYLLQVFTSFNSPFIDGLIHAVYMCVPLIYIAVIQRNCPQFDLVRMGNVFLCLMIPVNCVGFIQYFIDPQFLISPVYSVESGIIVRNLLYGGTFLRFPSIFASADRYSAMGLMQLYFTFVLLHALNKPSHRWLSWILVNLFSASAVLLISGARSRIIIAATVLSLAGAAFIIKAFSSPKVKNAIPNVSKVFPVLAILTVGYLFIGAINKNLDLEEIAFQFPVITLFEQSFEEDDISFRLIEAGKLSIIPDDVTLFGEGLGTIGRGGKPGEFGIRSIWVESGLVWGSMLLLGFLGIIFILIRLTCKAFLLKHPSEVSIYSLPLLLMIFALLAGLTSAFELSSGILLGCSIAVITRSSLKIPNLLRPVILHPIDPVRRRRL